MAVAKDGKTGESGDTVTSTSTMARKIDKSGLYDLMQVKRLLDDEVIALMEDEGYAEATLASTIKIVFGTIAVVAAVYSHFNRSTYPENRTLIAVCVALYGICTGIIQLATWVLEGGAFFVGALTKRALRTTRRGSAARVWARSMLGEKGSSEYVLILTQGARASKGEEMRCGYEKYISTEGRFLREEFRTSVREVLYRFSEKKSQ